MHVERAIRSHKVFKILRGTVPVSSLNNVIIVCAAQSYLIRDAHVDGD
jgi:hypothetical protein